MQYISGITISIFLVLLLLVKRKNNAELLLMYWLLALAIHIGLYYLDTNDEIGNYSFLIGLSIPFPILHGPFLYSYTSLLLNPKRKISNYWFHFLPFVFLNLFLIPFYSLSAKEKLYVFQNEGVGYEMFVVVNFALIFLSGIIYVTFSYLLIQKHKNNIKHKLSQIEGKTLDWLRFLIIGMGVIWLFVFIGNNDLIFSATALFVILIGILGIRQNSIFTNLQSTDIAEQAPLDFEKYKKSGLSLEKKVDLVKRLELLIQVEKPFLNHELSLNELAKKIDIQPNYLSQVLNENFELNFYDFINSKRIDEFCDRLKQKEFEHYKIVEIAYECGFNSKSAFNRNFKKFKGITPSKYKKELSGVSS